MIFRPPCAVCAAPASVVEVVEPGTDPDEWSSWEPARKEAFARYRNPGFHQLLYSGPGGSSGWVGDPISAARARMVALAFTPPFTGETLREAGFHDLGGLCEWCLAFFCEAHWSVSPIGVGTCPNGHLQSLDPHWSPDGA